MHETFGDGERLAVRYTVTGTHTGALMDISGTSHEFSMTGITIMQFEKWRVVGRWDSDDSGEVLPNLQGDQPS